MDCVCLHFFFHSIYLICNSVGRWLRCHYFQCKYRWLRLFNDITFSAFIWWNINCFLFFIRSTFVNCLHLLVSNKIAHHRWWNVCALRYVIYITFACQIIKLKRSSGNYSRSKTRPRRQTFSFYSYETQINSISHIIDEKNEKQIQKDHIGMSNPFIRILTEQMKKKNGISPSTIIQM